MKSNQSKQLSFQFKFCNKQRDNTQRCEHMLLICSYCLYFWSDLIFFRITKLPFDDKQIVTSEC